MVTSNYKTVISNCEVCACNFGSFQTDLRTIAK